MSDRDLSSLGPDDLLVLAARGDAVAQHSLAVMLEASVAAGMYDYGVGMRMAELMARMACSHPSAPAAWHRQLAAVLMHSSGAAEMEGRDDDMMDLGAESIEILDRLADEGDEEAGRCLVVANEMVPEMVQYAAARRRGGPTAVAETVH